MQIQLRMHEAIQFMQAGGNALESLMIFKQAAVLNETLVGGNFHKFGDSL